MKIFVILAFFWASAAAAMPFSPFIKQIKTRPGEAGSLDSQRFPLRIHYEKGVDLAYAQDLLTIAEQSWDKLFLQAGFLAPLPDGLEGGDSRTDLYIITTMQKGVGGYTSFSGFNDATPRADAIGYVVYAHDLAPLYRRGVVAHELFHLSQMAYDWWEDLSFMEASSVWASDFVFPDENIYWKYFVSFNREPFHSLDYVSLANPYQYGAALWVMFLEERFGQQDGTWLRKIWENCEQDSFENVPNFLTATATVLGGQSSLNAAFREFGAWRVFVGQRNDGHHFHKAANWDRTMEPYLEVAGFPGIRHLAGVSSIGLEPMSHAFLSFPRAKEKASYSFSFVGQNERHYGLDAYGFDGKVWQKVYSGPESMEAQSFTIENDGRFGEIMVIVSDLGDGHYDPNGTPWEKVPFSYRFDVK